MKKFLVFFSVLASVAFVACQKNSSVSGIEEPELDGPTGVISVSIETPGQTKAASIADSKINSAQLFVFGTDGKLETSRYYSTVEGADFKITSKVGTKTLYVVLNAERLNFSTISHLEEPTAASLADVVALGRNTSDNLVMSGKNSVNVVEYNANKGLNTTSQVTVYVKRLTAEVVVNKVTVNFDNTALQGATLILDDIGLVNVPGYSPYGVTSASTDVDNPASGIPVILPDGLFNNMSYWFNVGSLNKTTSPAVCFDASVNINCNVSGTETGINRYFLSYPNRATAFQENASPTAPVHTCLVIKGRLTANSSYAGAEIVAKYNNTDTYYTFDLPALEPNKQYTITDIKITMPGADNPGERVVTGKIDPTIVVDHWTGNTNLSYDF